MSDNWILALMCASAGACLGYLTACAMVLAARADDHDQRAHERRLLRDLATKVQAYERAERQRREMLSAAGKKGRASQLGGK